MRYSPLELYSREVQFVYWMDDNPMNFASKTEIRHSCSNFSLNSNCFIMILSFAHSLSIYKSLELFTYTWCNLPKRLYVCGRYFRHASGEVFVISQDLAQFVSINRLIISACSCLIHTCRHVQHTHIQSSFYLCANDWVSWDEKIMKACNSFCRSILRTFTHDDISAGSWFIGLDVKHIDEAKLCCSSSSSGNSCEF